MRLFTKTLITFENVECSWGWYFISISRISHLTFDCFVASWKGYIFQFQHHVALHFCLNWSIKQTNMWSTAIKPPGWQCAGYFCCWALPSLKEDEIKTAFILFFDILPACSNTLLCPSLTVTGEEWLSKLSSNVP